MNDEIIYGTLGDGYIAKLDNKYTVYYFKRLNIHEI